MALLREKLLAAAARCPNIAPRPDTDELFEEEYMRLAGKKELTGSYAIIPPFYRPLPKDEDVLQQKLRYLIYFNFQFCCNFVQYTNVNRRAHSVHIFNAFSVTINKRQYQSKVLWQGWF
jgi:hypothetical protein